MAEEKTYNMPEMNTTDPIALTFMLWDDFELVRALADKFTEKYPNITVELIHTSTDTVQSELINMAANKEMPDTNITSPATFGARTIPGFNAFINDYYHNSDFNGVIGIHNAVFQGAVDAYDYIEILNAKGREYYDAAIKSFTANYGVAE